MNAFSSFAIHVLIYQSCLHLHTLWGLLIFSPSTHHSIPHKKNHQVNWAGALIILYYAKNVQVPVFKFKFKAVLIRLLVDRYEGSFAQISISASDLSFTSSYSRCCLPCLFWKNWPHCRNLGLQSSGYEVWFSNQCERSVCWLEPP